MKNFFSLLAAGLLLSSSARAEESHKHLVMNLGPEAYESSLFRNGNFTARPAAEMQFSFNERLAVLMFLNYSEFTYVSDRLSRWTVGPGFAYDLIPQRLRLSARVSFSSLSYRNFDPVTVFGAGLHLVYFVPIGDPWRFFVGAGWDTFVKANLRHDQNPGNSDTVSCAFICSQDEKAGHTYDRLIIPGSREISSQIGVSYSFF